jgi:dTDP-4-dehydrorhamnose reductase
MRILLTGITGQVGAALEAPLEPLGTLVKADRSLIDLSRPDTIGPTLSRLEPDLIINPAAYTAVDRAEEQRELAFRVNCEAPGAMAKWAAARGIPFIHFSTDYVFDGAGSLPWSEDSPTGPLSVYGASKLAGEALVRSAKGPHLIVRTSWVYAARGANFLRTIARLARERKRLQIVADQIGAPTSARAIADAVARIVESNRPELPRRFAACGGLVNIACAGETSWHGFAAAIVAGLRARCVKLEAEEIAPIHTQDYPTIAKRPANSRLDLTRLRTNFGIVMPSWDDALRVELDALAAEFI